MDWFWHDQWKEFYSIPLTIHPGKLSDDLSQQLRVTLQSLKKLELLDVRGKLHSIGYFLGVVIFLVLAIVLVHSPCMPAENGLPFSLAAQLASENPKCRFLRIMTCKCCHTNLAS